jgi:hypothetical protein
VPAEPGETVLEISDGVLTATSSADGTEIIRTTARVGDEIAGVARGQLRYITDVDGTLTSGLTRTSCRPSRRGRFSASSSSSRTTRSRPSGRRIRSR